MLIMTFMLTFLFTFFFTLRIAGIVLMFRSRRTKTLLAVNKLLLLLFLFVCFISLLVLDFSCFEK
jgi:hypothetical protein